MRTASPDAGWNDAIIAKLIGLWDAGLSTAEIGRRLGVSKNAVVGKAHRLDLPARPSPIRKGQGSPRKQGQQQRRAVGPTLPLLGCLLPVQTPPGQRPVPSAVVVVPLAPPKPEDRPKLGTDRCCWPLGDPGRSSFRFCDEPNKQGRPYCPDHCRLAYVPKKPNNRYEAA
jgi:GcrA cell cycle regulator